MVPDRTSIKLSANNILNKDASSSLPLDGFWAAVVGGGPSGLLLAHRLLVGGASHVEICKGRKDPQMLLSGGGGCWTNMRTRTKRTRGTENPDEFIRLNMRIVRLAHFSFITHVERQLCIVDQGYAIVTKQE
jgi:predicted flavoprotein YhiN